MSFIFGQSVEDIGETLVHPAPKCQESKPCNMHRIKTDKVVLVYGRHLVNEEQMSIHNVGCKAIRHEAMKYWGHIEGRFRDTKTAIESCIDEQSCYMGFGEEYGNWDRQIKVHNCAKDESYKANVKENPVYLHKQDLNY
jgi:hypothetical protein